MVTLERLTLDFGASRRRMQVQKLRGVDFIAGYHDLAIRTGGLNIFPRLIAANHHAPFAGDPTPSGVGALDALPFWRPTARHQHPDHGAGGFGKDHRSPAVSIAACERGEAATLYQFDERIGTLMVRAKAMGMDLEKHIGAGRLTIRQIDPAEMSPGEFAAEVRDQIEARQVRLIVIDSLNGYLAAMPQEKQLLLQIHEMLSYLNQQGVVTLMINPQHGLVGPMASNLDVSYVSDTVIPIRFFEAGGRIRKAISVIKNRGGPHEDTIRELRIDGLGVRIGEPLIDFKGVTTGTPEYVGVSAPLMEDRSE
ncbi:ATPase domain-containing protein [Caulobacter segnis]